MTVAGHTERLGPLDASFLYFEDGVSHMHIGSCTVFAGPAPAYDDVVAAMTAKLDRVPRYRQVVRFVPLQLGLPVWVDDPHFTLEYHVRRSALPHPGGPAELRQLMGGLMSQELDRHRPLWETWMVEGLAGGRWALISKIHHCMVDGVSGTDLLALILDRAPVRREAPSDGWAPEPQPSNLRLAADALVRLAVSPYEQLRATRRLLRAPRHALSRFLDVAGGMGAYARQLVPTPVSSLVGPIGPGRRWTWTSAGLDDLKAVRRTLGGTVNDVILAAVAAGFRDLLLSRGETVDGLTLRTLVPVSVRQQDEHTTYNNRVSAVFAELPVGLGEPLSRLTAVQRQMETLKHSHQTLAGESLTAFGELVPFVTVAASERAIMSVLRHVGQHSINTVVTNVPGPQFPLYLAGCEMLEYLPYVPITYGVRVGVAIVSYNGSVAFGITGDYDTTADIDVLAHGIDGAIAELVVLTR